MNMLIEIFGRPTEISDENFERGEGSRNILSKVNQYLIINGAKDKAIIEHSDYGWEVTTIINNCKIQLIIQLSDPYLLIVKNKTTLINKVLYKNRFEFVVDFINKALHNISGIKRVVWYDKSLYDSGVRDGAEIPNDLF